MRLLLNKLRMSGLSSRTEGRRAQVFEGGCHEGCVSCSLTSSQRLFGTSAAIVRHVGSFQHPSACEAAFHQLHFLNPATRNSEICVRKVPSSTLHVYSEQGHAAKHDSNYWLSEPACRPQHRLFKT